MGDWRLSALQGCGKTVSSTVILSPAFGGEGSAFRVFKQVRILRRPCAPQNDGATEFFPGVGPRWRGPLLLPIALLLCVASVNAQVEQVETAASPAPAAQWVSYGHAEGHLALKNSSDGAFSPDSSLLAVTADEKVLVMNLRDNSVQKVIKPRIPDIQDLEIHSASFVSPQKLFVLANGVFRVKGKGAMPTPLLAFKWDLESDQLDGKASAVGAKGGYSPARCSHHSLPRVVQGQRLRPLESGGGARGMGHHPRI